MCACVTVFAAHVTPPPQLVSIYDSELRDGSAAHGGHVLASYNTFLAVDSSVMSAGRANIGACAEGLAVICL